MWGEDMEWKVRKVDFKEICAGKKGFERFRKDYLELKFGNKGEGHYHLFHLHDDPLWVDTCT